MKKIELRNIIKEEIRKIIKEDLPITLNQFKFDDRFKNNDRNITIIKVDNIQSDMSGPHATTGTSINKYTVKALNKKVSLDYVKNWAKKIFKNTYMIDRKINQIKSLRNNEFEIYVESKVWHN